MAIKHTKIRLFTRDGVDFVKKNTRPICAKKKTFWKKHHCDEYNDKKPLQRIYRTAWHFNKCERRKTIVKKNKLNKKSEHKYAHTYTLVECTNRWIKVTSFKNKTQITRAHGVQFGIPWHHSYRYITNNHLLIKFNELVSYRLIFRTFEGKK